MSQETEDGTTRERNPRFPNETLKDAIDRIEKLFTSLGRSAAPAEAIAKAIGFTGLSGASRSALAALSYYGLTSRESSKYKVSDLALKIIRPVNASDKANAIWEACFAPKLFAEIQRDHSDCSESMLASILIHKGFTQVGADWAAHVFKDNLAFAGTFGYPPKEIEAGQILGQTAIKQILTPPQMTSISAVAANELPVPIGDNMVARVPFPMTEDDFNLLLGTLNLWKKKLVRQLPDSPKELNPHAPTEQILRALMPK